MDHQRLDLSSNELEPVWLELRFPNNSKTLIGSIYRPPNTDLDVFKTNLEKVLETISSERARATLVGDLNVHMKRKRLTPQARSLNQLFKFLYQLDQLVREPTRITEHTSSLIDLGSGTILNCVFFFYPGIDFKLFKTLYTEEVRRAKRLCNKQQDMSVGRNILNPLRSLLRSGIIPD